MRRPADPIRLPGTTEPIEATLCRGRLLAGTPGQTYVERRGISVAVAEAAGVRFMSDFAGRPAVIAGLHDQHGQLRSVHARYLSVSRMQDKMLTIGPGGGMVDVLGGWRGEPLVLVEGLFDALSLAMCGIACAGTIGRWAPWIAEIAGDRTVWLAFDAGRSGDAEAARYGGLLRASQARRLLPPARAKDWNTALVKRGRSVVASWIRRCCAADMPA